MGFGGFPSWHNNYRLFFSVHVTLARTRVTLTTYYNVLQPLEWWRAAALSRDVAALRTPLYTRQRCLLRIARLLTGEGLDAGGLPRTLLHLPLLNPTVSAP